MPRNLLDRFSRTRIRALSKVHMLKTYSFESYLESGVPTSLFVLEALADFDDSAVRVNYPDSSPASDIAIKI